MTDTADTIAAAIVLAAGRVAFLHNSTFSLDGVRAELADALRPHLSPAARPSHAPCDDCPASGHCRTCGRDVALLRKGWEQGIATRADLSDALAGAVDAIRRDLAEAARPEPLSRLSDAATGVLEAWRRLDGWARHKGWTTGTLPVFFHDAMDELQRVMAHRDTLNPSDDDGPDRDSRP